MTVMHLLGEVGVVIESVSLLKTLPCYKCYWHRPPPFSRLGIGTITCRVVAEFQWKC